jgi:purine-binding chemotaxis protein CheW
MDVRQLSDSPWVIVSLDRQLFGISSKVLKSMVVLRDVVAVPQVPPYVRGVMNLRGAVLKVVDMRRRLGLKSLADETNDFCTMLEQRKQDHMNWLAKLESCVKEGRAIDVQTDPHKCAFGKWYDVYRTDSVVLSSLLSKFDAPHKRVHGVARTVEGLMARHDVKQAQAVIDACRGNELAQMMKLFDEVREHVRHEGREIAVVLEGQSGDFAIAVDSVESVEALKEGSIESMDVVNKNSLDKGLLPFIGCRRKTDAFVKIIDIEHILK